MKQNLKSMYEIVHDVSGIITNALFALFLLAAVGLFGYAMYQEFKASERHLVIDPIGVPIEIAKAGYSATISSHILIDKISSISDYGLSFINPIEKTVVEANWSKPDIVIPSANISMRSIADIIRTSFPINRHVVGGELFLNSESGNLVCLRLRINNEYVRNELKNCKTLKNMNSLFEEGAISVIRATDPDVLASYYFRRAFSYFRKNDEDGFNTFISKFQNECDRILEPNATVKLRSIVRAYNLKGLSHMYQGDLKMAFKNFEQSTKRDSRYSPAYYNWGLALVEQHLYGEAIEKFKKVIELSSGSATVYYYLGISLAMENDRNNAIRKLIKAVELSVQEDYSAAIESFENFIRLSQDVEKKARAYYNWGIILGLMGDDRGAIDKCWAASDFDSNFKRICRKWKKTLDAKDDLINTEVPADVAHKIDVLPSEPIQEGRS